MNRQSELKLFYNDIKYVTRSLAKDSEALYSCIVANSRRHKQRDPREIEAFMRDEEKRLDELKKSLHQFRKLAKWGKQRFHIEEWNSFKELDDLLEKQIGITEELKPAPMWFDRKNIHEIQDMLDDVQTKTEDSEKSRKRIFKVWSKEVLEPHNVRFTIEYVDMLGTGMKIFHTNFWKYKKHLKTLFIEDESLYSDAEIRLLKKNVAIMTENDNWLYFKKRRIAEALGENYIGKETDFNKIRKNYDRFYTWLTAQTKEKQVTYEEFPEYCDYIRQLRKTEYLEYFQKLEEYMPFLDSEFVYNMSFIQLESQIADYVNALSIIKNHYGISYLHEMKGTFHLDKWNKLIQRVIEKEGWLNNKKEEIEQCFGGIYKGLSTNWELMKECISDDEVNGIPESRIKQYGFLIYEEKQMEETAETLDQAIQMILEQTGSLSVKVLIKRVCSLLGMKRVTQKLKKEIEMFLQTSLPEKYQIEDGFIVPSSQEQVKFYIAPDKGKRDVETVSNQEMMYGILRVIEVENEITLDDLTKLFSKLLGYPRRTKGLQTQVEYAVKQLKKDGRIVRKSGGWSLLEKEAVHA